ARVIHNQGAGHNRPFAALDCRRLPPVAVAAALFEGGRLVRRAGTLLLREPACLSRDLQPGRAPWLPDAAPRRPAPTPPPAAAPADAARAGRLIEELAAALTVLVVDVPPLRERGDLAWLAERMLRNLGGPVTLTREALAVLAGHRWPGNLRELLRVLAEAHAH